MSWAWWVCELPHTICWSDTCVHNVLQSFSHIISSLNSEIERRNNAINSKFWSWSSKNRTKVLFGLIFILGHLFLKYSTHLRILGECYPIRFFVGSESMLCFRFEWGFGQSQHDTSYFCLIVDFGARRRQNILISNFEAIATDYVGNDKFVGIPILFLWVYWFIVGHCRKLW